MYDFSMLYTTLPHNLIKKKLNGLIEWTFHREGPSMLHVTEEIPFFTSEKHRKLYFMFMSESVRSSHLHMYLRMYVRYGTKLFRQIVDVPMGANCAQLQKLCAVRTHWNIHDLFLFVTKATS